jgi:hypothetical protein
MMAWIEAETCSGLYVTIKHVWTQLWGKVRCSYSSLHTQQDAFAQNKVTVDYYMFKKGTLLKAIPSDSVVTFRNSCSCQNIWAKPFWNLNLISFQWKSTESGIIMALNINITCRVWGSYSLPRYILYLYYIFYYYLYYIYYILYFYRLGINVSEELAASTVRVSESCNFL